MVGEMDAEQYYETVMIFGTVLALVIVLVIVIVWRTTARPSSIEIENPADRDVVLDFLSLSEEGKKATAEVARSYRDGY